MQRVHVPVSDFDPNKTPNDQGAYGVYDGFQWRISNRRTAIQRFWNAHPGSIWEATPQGWVCRGNSAVDRSHDPCDHCGRPQDGTRHRLSWRRENGKIAPVLDLMLLCLYCLKANER